jgi:L-lactate dehydrogenase complex protein LldG
MTAREEVLARIRAALGPAPGAGREAVPRGYRTSSDLDISRLSWLLTERLDDYGAKVRRCRPDEVATAVGAALTERGVRRIVVPPGLDPAYLITPGEASIVVDGGLPAEALDAVDGVITTAAVAVAETGTIILDGGPGQGRRAVSLIPDYHLCILHAAQIVALVPQALERLDPVRPLTWISGPSATSDIELDRVQGVHGPRTLEVILAGP